MRALEFIRIVRVNMYDNTDQYHDFSLNTCYNSSHGMDLNECFTCPPLVNIRIVIVSTRCSMFKKATFDWDAPKLVRAFIRTVSVTTDTTVQLITFVLTVRQTLPVYVSSLYMRR